MILPAEARERHGQTAELHGHVEAGGEFLHPPLPLDERLLTAASVGAKTNHSADMVTDDRQLREGSRQIGELPELVHVGPGIVAQVELIEACDALSELRVPQQTGRRIHVGLTDRGARMPRAGVADSPEPGAGRKVGLEHRRDTLTEPQVCVADNGRRDRRGAFRIGQALAGDALHELGLAHRPKLDRSVLAVTRPALHENRIDQVKAPGIVHQIGHQVPKKAGPIPHVMVGIADG